MRVVRSLVVPALVVVAALAVFHRAFAPVDLALAMATASLAGAGAGLALGVRRLPWPPGVVVAGAALAAGAAALGGRVAAVTAVPDAYALFLTVGLPATGLRDLLLVPYSLGALGVAAAVIASLRSHPLGTLAPAVAVTAIGSVLVLPVGIASTVPVAVAMAGALVLLLDARTDLSSMPPLVGTNTEVRRQVVWWRPLVQFVPAVLAVVALTAILPRGRTIDVRQFVEPRTERLADANPLAVAGRAPRLAADEVRPLAGVVVDGPSPGRLRLAVLDRYTPTGWQHAADFSITGETLAADPLYRAEPGGGPGPDRAAALAPVETAVEVRPDPSYDDLRTVPTGGVPRSVDEPARVRYAASAGLLLARDPGLGVRYRTEAPAPDAPSLAGAGTPTVGRFPPELATCPDSEPVQAIAAQLVAGTRDASARLERIESFLKVRRVYDPASPGGQTLRSVERFLAQDYGRGNLEVFVSAHALLARCAGVPVRVVVGLPAPAPDAPTAYTNDQVTAWIETPLARSGWRAFDPLPTPDEQAQQAQLARQSEPPPPDPEPAEVPPAPRVIEPAERAVERPLAAYVLGAALAIIATVAAAWTFGLPALVARRRRRAAEPTAAVHASWAAVAEALVDRDLGIDAPHTPSEVARLVGGRLPVVVARLIEGLAPIVDRVRYSGQPATPEDAAQSWAYAHAILERLPATRARWLAPVRRPGQALERWRSTRGVPRQRAAWRGTLPDTALLRSGAAPDDVPGVTLAAKVGEGSTGTVYRGVLDATRTPVAVKVFRYGPGDAGFDAHRFDWEVRIARTVSGLPHLPTVHDAGITPASHRPYLVSTLYDDGTLLDRVRRGGPLTAAEAVLLGADLASALATLHQLGVVHTDVKPENVFAAGSGWVLGDLGSAWLRASRGPAATMTPPYAAPEVWRGASPSPSSDLYSLALTMMFAATGQVPTASITPASDDVEAAFPDHPVVARALEPDPRRRPRSAADLARALRPQLAASHTGPGLTTLSLPTPTGTHGRT